MLTLDPDVIAVKPITRELLLPHGRALLEPEARSVHCRWWRDSADLLGVDPRLEEPGMNVSPALLSTVVLHEVQRRLEAIGGRPWMDVLLTSYCDWTEYTLYLLAAEQADAVNRYHLWADDPQAPAHVHTRPDLSIWDSATASREHLERLFLRTRPVRSRPEQQRSGPSEIAAVARITSRSGASVQEDQSQGPSRPVAKRSRVAMRIVAQGVYRVAGSGSKETPFAALGRRAVAGGADRVASEWRGDRGSLACRIDDRDQGQQLITGIPALPTSRSPHAESMAVPAWSF